MTGPAAVLAFTGGTVWRWHHVTRFHDPRGYVYSDMAVYVSLARRLATSGYVPTAEDALQPPGAPLLFAWFYQHDPSLGSLVWFQFAVTALVPLAVGALALVAFGTSTAKLAVGVSSLYFPFVDYGGYFLTEIYMMLCIPVALALFLWAIGLPSMARTAGTAFLAGIVFTGALALKLLSVPVLLGFCAIHWLFFTAAPRRLKTIAVVALLTGTLPGVVVLSQRCARTNDGRFCLISNGAASQFLLGHYGRARGIIWRDPDGRTGVRAGSTSTYHQRYLGVVEVPFGITDESSNFRAAAGWIRAHPAEALAFSAEHVYDLFLGIAPWPAYATDDWPWAEGAQLLFIVFLLLPTVGLCLDAIRRQGLRAFLGSTEMAVLSPILGVIAAAFLATGEPRYRIPFDGLFIILAIEFYRRLGRDEA